MKKRSPLDVFDFDEQDNEAEVIAAKYSCTFKNSEPLDKFKFLQNCKVSLSLSLSLSHTAVVCTYLCVYMYDYYFKNVFVVVYEEISNYKP